NLELMGTTSGVVLLAFQPEEQRERLVGRLASTPGFSRSRRQFLSRLESVCRNGYAEFPSEAIEGIIDISYPIFDHTGVAVAALTMPYLTTRLRQSNRKDVRGAMAQTARNITSALGGRRSV